MTGSSQPPRDSDPAGGVRGYLSPSQAAQRLGIPLETFRSRVRGGYYAAVLGQAAPGDVIRAGSGRGSSAGYSEQVTDQMAAWDVADDPARLGEDPASLDDGMLIGPLMWAALQGVTRGRVYQQLREARAQRARGRSGASLMPEPGQVRGRRLLWLLGAYRAWREASRGQESGRGGRRRGSGEPRL
jgi:hypothetical protein